MQKPGNDTPVEEQARGEERRLRQHVEETGHQEKWNILQVIELDAADTVDILMGSSCFGLGAGLNGVLRKSSTERKPPLTCIMRATVNQDMFTTLRIISVAAIA